MSIYFQHDTEKIPHPPPSPPTKKIETPKKIAVII